MGLIDMKEYKCISCGNLKSSEKPCTCPRCGYKMFTTPFERDEVLKKEIVMFIDGLRVNEIDLSKLEAYREKNKNKAQRQLPERLSPFLNLILYCPERMISVTIPLSTTTITQNNTDGQ